MNRKLFLVLLTSILIGSQAVHIFHQTAATDVDQDATAVAIAKHHWKDITEDEAGKAKVGSLDWKEDRATSATNKAQIKDIKEDSAGKAKNGSVDAAEDKATRDRIIALMADRKEDEASALKSKQALTQSAGYNAATYSEAIENQATQEFNAGSISLFPPYKPLQVTTHTSPNNSSKSTPSSSANSSHNQTPSKTPATGSKQHLTSNA